MSDISEAPQKGDIRFDRLL